MTDPKSFRIVQELGQCVAAALADTPAGPPDRVCVVVPGQIAWDKCDCGQLALTVTKWFWSQDQNLTQATNFGGDTACGLPYLVADVTISILRCAPVGKATPQGQLAPSCEQLEAAALILHEDAQAVRFGAGCCLKEMEEANDILAFALLEQRVVGPQGLCVGSELAVRIGLSNCLCPSTFGS